MAITYQFNKTSLQSLEKDLKMRQRTLPTLQSKETALRLEVKKAKKEAEAGPVTVNIPPIPQPQKPLQPQKAATRKAPKKLWQSSLKH